MIVATEEYISRILRNIEQNLRKVKFIEITEDVAFWQKPDVKVAIHMCMTQNEVTAKHEDDIRRGISEEGALADSDPEDGEGHDAEEG